MKNETALNDNNLRLAITEAEKKDEGFKDRLAVLYYFDPSKSSNSYAGNNMYFDNIYAIKEIEVFEIKWWKDFDLWNW